MSVNIDYANYVKSLNSFWLGFRYTVMSVPSIDTLSLSFTKYVDLASLGVSEIVMPTINAEMFVVPSLSSREHRIPKKMTYGPLVLRAPTFRNSAFYQRIFEQDLSIAGEAHALNLTFSYDGVKEDIVIAEYETRTAMDVIPIAVYAASGCQAASFTPASASVYSTDIPMDELVLNVDKFQRIV